MSLSVVFVGGLAPDVDEQLVRRVFGAFGPIDGVSMPAAETAVADFGTDAPHRGFAFVTFEDANDAQEAVANMDGAELKDRVLSVNVSRASKAGTWHGCE